MSEPTKISVVIFINPLAGNGRFAAVESAVLKYLIHHKIEHIVFTDNWPIEIPSCTHVFIIGGDGTINFFVNDYPFNRVPVSVFKAGTGNDFAWKLYSDIPVAAQIQKALNGEVHLVDAGECNGKFFLNGVGIGFDGAVVQDMRRSLKVFTGWFAYYYSVLKTINGFGSKLMSVSYSIGADNTCEDETKIFMITIANGSRFGGDFIVAPEAVVDDGKFELVIIHAVPIWKRYLYLPRMKKGRHTSLPFVKSVQITSVKIKAREPVPAHLDGEWMFDDNFEIIMHPGRFAFRY
ncbi:MAG: YegS/Rv2252/BmrU family lipid kinase [Chitinophagaceae bacterium]|nr:MAG: YegS/Rv2252/BmrU family lipid kinase [Chitinophagaceae bacterium]